MDNKDALLALNKAAESLQIKFKPCEECSSLFVAWLFEGAIAISFDKHDVREHYCGNHETTKLKNMVWDRVCFILNEFKENITEILAGMRLEMER